MDGVWGVFLFISVGVGLELKPTVITPFYLQKMRRFLGRVSTVLDSSFSIDHRFSRLRY